MNPCLLIPIYDHGSTIREVVQSLEYLDLPCLIIDDGSDSETREILDKLEGEFDWVEIHHRPQNGGRGAAMRDGYLLAGERGFSHAIHLDADRQHCASDVPKFLDAIREQPEAAVFGQPIFDDTAPAIRLFGRKFSQGLVWLETLSLGIRDPLCGYRSIPTKSTAELLQKQPCGDGMEFDIEFGVRMMWHGVPVRNVPTRVQYFEGGISHFRGFWDTARIAGTHGKLVLGMLIRSPWLIGRRLRGKP